MKKIIGALIALAFSSLAQAQDALVVTTCGTLPQAYAVGSSRLMTVDTTGKLCLSMSGAPPVGAAGGSLKGTYPNPSLADVNSIATSLAIGGATIGTNSLAVTGNGTISGTLAYGNWRIGGTAIPTTSTFAFIGDSLTNGFPTGTSPVSGITPPTYQGQALSLQNVAINGAKASDAVQNFTPQNNVYAAYGGGNGVLVWLGASDLTAGSSAIQIYTLLEQICRHERLLGNRVIIGTLISHAGTGVETIRNALNTLIYNNWYQFADGIADFAANANIGATNAYTNGTYFQADGIHLTASGYAIVTTVMQTAMTANYSGVNQVNYTSGLTGVPPIFQAYGSDTNIGISILGKGSGALKLNTINISNAGILYPTTDSASAISIAQADGVTTFIGFDTLNRRLGVGTLTPDAAIQITGTSHFGSAATFDSNITLSNTGAGILWSGQSKILNNGNGDVSITNSSNALGIFRAGTIVVGTADATTSTGGALQVTGGASIAKRLWIPAITASAGLQTAVLCQSSGGEMIADSVACLASSERFKEDIAPSDMGLDTVMALKPIIYRYRKTGNDRFDNAPNQRDIHAGFSAEQAALVDGRLVARDKDGNVRTIRPDAVPAALVRAVQELTAKVERLEAR